MFNKLNGSCRTAELSHTVLCGYGDDVIMLRLYAIMFLPLSDLVDTTRIRNRVTGRCSARTGLMLTTN